MAGRDELGRAFFFGRGVSGEDLPEIQSENVLYWLPGEGLRGSEQALALGAVGEGWDDAHNFVRSPSRGRRGMRRGWRASINLFMAH